MKRATISAVCYFFDIFISIHALVKRATNRRALQKSTKFNFNPRPREEGDSILFSSCRCVLNFNPRPREEGDLTAAQNSLKYVLFQSTPSWRGRPGYNIIKKGCFCISIHALVKRATLLKYCLNRCKWISIHALVKRATYDIQYYFCKSYISIHALVKRATFLWKQLFTVQVLFQSTPSWRGRRGFCK